LLKFITSIVQKLIQILMPETTHNLKIEIKKEKYFAKKILQNHQQIEINDV
jgi:hypothetical protein